MTSDEVKGLVVHHGLPGVAEFPVEHDDLRHDVADGMDADAIELEPDSCDPLSHIRGRDLLCQGNATEKNTHFVVERNRGRSIGAAGGFSCYGSQVDGFSSHDVKGAAVHHGVSNFVKSCVDGLDLAQEDWNREDPDVTELSGDGINPGLSITAGRVFISEVGEDDDKA